MSALKPFRSLILEAKYAIYTFSMASYPMRMVARVTQGAILNKAQSAAKMLIIHNISALKLHRSLVLVINYTFSRASYAMRMEW